MAIKTLPQIQSNDNMDIATSELTKKNRISAFNIKNTVITGEPRYDIFFRNIDKYSILKKYSLEKYYNKRIISYLPTFREYESEYKKLFTGKTNIDRIENAVIFEKSHPVVNRVTSDSTMISEQLVDISNLNMDSQELLAVTDVLITDYSGCFVDFLLTGKPIILYLYDLEEYKEKRGLYFEIEQLNTGAVVYTENELVIAIVRYLNNPELDSEKRKEVRNNFHDYQDGLSSERVYKEILKLIN